MAYSPSLSLPLIIDKLANLIPNYTAPNSISYNTIHLVTHIPTSVSIDVDVDGYYLLAPTSYTNPYLIQQPFYDYEAGDFPSSTTNPKAIALGWLLTVIEHAAVQALEDLMPSGKISFDSLVKDNKVLVRCTLQQDDPIAKNWIDQQHYWLTWP